MTLLAAWVGVDLKKNGPSVGSIYIATDSRFTWSQSTKYDQGAKVFGMRNHPDIFGFCGDVIFPTIILKNLIDQGDAGILYSPGMLPDQKYALLKDKITDAIASYPKEATSGSFTIIYATRDAANKFHCFQLDWNSSTGFRNEQERIPLPDYSTVLAAEGSGAKHFKRKFEDVYKLKSHNNFGTSRAVYHCFTDTLEEAKDPACGGAPQIVGLYRGKPTCFFGIIKNGERFFMGQPVKYSEILSFVEWRNDQFERCDPESTEILGTAQRQPKS